MSSDHVYPAPASRTPLGIVLNLIRGALIGLAEMVPGISGGTVALVTGIYERALRNGNALLGRTFKSVEWLFLITVGIGMVAAVFTMSGIMHAFVENSPEHSRALFLGMVAMSIFVPIAMIDPREARAKAAILIPAFLLAAVVTFIGTGFSAATQSDPSLLVIFLAASVAICALVLPGVSGSFFLLAIGLYAPVMGAISERNLSVIAVFAAGALLGIVLFIRLLGIAMDKYRTMTLTIMAGLMLGSLRALWPWQGEDAQLQPPGDNFLVMFGLAVLGAAIVFAVIFAERVSRKRSEIIDQGQPS